MKTYASRDGRVVMPACVIVAVLAASCATERPEPVAQVEFTVSEGTRLGFDVNPVDGSIVFDLLGQLWMMPPDGGRATPLTDAVRDRAGDADPVLSPDGKWVAFNSDRAGGMGLWVMPADGGTPRRLTTMPAWLDTDITPAWSPDGTQLAFIRGAGPAAAIHILDVADGSVRRLEIEGLPAPGARNPAWSPDGDHFVFVNAGRWGPGGPIWRVPVGGGQAARLVPAELRTAAPAPSPDGTLLAFVAPDSADRPQLWLRDLDGGIRQLTDQADLVSRPVRWSPDGRAVLYGAEGRLWRVGVDGVGPHEVPFRARVRFDRHAPPIAPPALARTGRQAVRGHMGAALAPDATRTAIIALGKLWLWDFRSAPRAVAEVPIGGDAPTWSPDGTRVAWNAGLKGTEDLYVTEVGTGTTSRLTRFDGAALRPSWSPDGRWIAFVYESDDAPPTVRVVQADAGRTLMDLEESREVAERPHSWWFLFPYGQEVAQWSPDAAGLLVTAETQWPPGSDARVVGTLHLLDGERRELFADDGRRTFIQWSSDGTVAFIRDNLLWRARLDPEQGLVEEGLVSEEPALYPSISRDGTILFLSTDGFRLARPEGGIEKLGRPLSYDVAPPGEPLLIRNVRLIDGTGRPPAGLSDIRIADGRIQRIAPAGELMESSRYRSMDAAGRTAIPGLIDVHAHVWDDLLLPGLVSLGVTTIRDALSPIARTAGLRESIEAGIMAGPRVVFGGFQFGTDTPTRAGASGHIGQTVGGRESIERALALARAFGADYAKLYFSGAATGYDFVSIARAHGMTVSGHGATSLPLIAAGFSGKEHLGQSGDRSNGNLYDDVVALYREAGLWVVPTITVFASAQRVAEDPGILQEAERRSLISPFMRAWVGRPLGEAGLRTRALWADAARRSARRLKAGGVTIAAGSDLIVPWAIHWEMEELVGIGFTPMEAIQAATSVAADVLGAADQTGTIEVGKLADLVLLDADPLDDIRNTQRIHAVVLNGRLLDRTALDAVLTSVAAAPPSPESDRDRNVATSAPVRARIDTISIEVREGTRLSFDLSPDGRTVVFDLLGQLWLLPAEGGEARPLTDAVRDTADDRRPAFSPDGRRIAFASNRPGHERGVWVIPVTGGEARLLPGTAEVRPDVSPVWRPQGDRLAFVNGGRVQVWSESDGSISAVSVDTVFGGSIRDVDWTPDGERLVLTETGGPEPGGRIWEVAWQGGDAVLIETRPVPVRAPAWAPDGRHIAFLSPDPAGRPQLWVRARSEDGGLMVSDHADVRLGRVRWSADGGELVYVADGGLWRVASDGGEPRPIPFRARLTIERNRSALDPVRFPAPATTRNATGHAGLALSPDGTTIAILALGRLWTLAPGGEPREVAAVPLTAAGLTWSPDGAEIAWSAGAAGTQELFITTLRTGTSRRATDVPGQATRPSWSPDGRHIAFVHWEKPALPTPAWFREDDRLDLRVVATASLAAGPVALNHTRNVARLPYSWHLQLSQETPQWAPDSEALLFRTVERGGVRTATVVTLEGEQREVPLPHANPTFVQWAEDGAIHYIRGNRLWRATFSTDSGAHGEATALTAGAALYPSVSRDGSVLYLAEDGLALRRPGGETEHLGWPLRYRTPDEPPDLLIRDVRIIDGTGRPPTEPSDVLIAGGRIASISPAGDGGTRGATRVIDGGGRFMIPGLIDAHVHASGIYLTSGFDEMLRGLLYHGILTVRDMGAPIAGLAAARDAIDAGVMAGPRIVLGGFQFYPAPSDHAGLSAAVTQAHADEAASARGLALAAAFGARYVKMREALSLASAVPVVRSAREAGVPVSGHNGAALPLVAAGIDGQEHAGLVYDDVIALWRAGGVWVVPTIVAFSQLVWLTADTAVIDAPGHTEFVSPGMRNAALGYNPAGLPGWERTATSARQGVRKLHDAGVLLAAGSDGDLPWMVHWELVELVEAGLSPMEALVAATGSAARVLGAGEEVGTIEAGKLADLVILDADPVDDIRNTQRIWMVIQSGRVVDREALLTGHPSMER